jgi:hypothetical protein
VADVEPGSVPDITAARIHALPALYKAAAGSLPTLADKGYIGAGIGILIPVRRPNGRSEQALHVDTRMFNTLLRHARAVGERTAAELKQRWRALQHVTFSPHRIGDIARVALVLNRAWMTFAKKTSVPWPEGALAARVVRFQGNGEPGRGTDTALRRGSEHSGRMETTWMC